MSEPSVAVDDDAPDPLLVVVGEVIATALVRVDRDWCITAVNEEAARYLLSAPEEMLGRHLWTFFPSATGGDFERISRRAMVEGGAAAFDAYYPEPLDAWFEVRILPTDEGLAMYFVEATARRAAQEEAERAVERALLTARVTAHLAETLEVEHAVARLAQLVVPALADWCVVTLVDDSDPSGGVPSLRDIASWHVDETARPLVQRYAATRLAALREPVALAQAQGMAEEVVVTESATELIRAALRPGEARDLLDRLAPGSVALLPMRARGRTLGALSLFNGPERGPTSNADLANAEEVAGRAGLALDNARLYRQQRRLAEGLQRSLLTQPPEPDHVEIVVRYEPAAEAAQIGGDWYDAFLQPDGATVLVIGDVMGHDVVAAAGMGQVRSMLRGIAVATGAGPAELLERVDAAIRTLQTDTIATVLVARLEQTPDERARGTCRVRWSNAGHPEPVVIHADGSTGTLAGRPDPLLGVAPDTRRVESEAVLERGATLLFFTDGLVERRSESLDEGMARLTRVLEELTAHEGTLGDLADAVLARMSPDRPEDDVALLAVRLHPQDRPRPPEAGPQRVPPGVPPDVPAPVPSRTPPNGPPAPVPSGTPPNGPPARRVAR